MGWLERLDVSTETGDLFDADAEGVVITIKTSLTAYGKISRTLFERSGDKLQADLRTAALRYGPERLTIGKSLSVVARPEYGLKHAQCLIFVAMWSEESPYTMNLGFSCYASALREAFCLGLTSLALPIFTMGRGQRGAIMTDEAIVRLLTEFDGLRTADTFPVERMLFVSINSEQVERLRLFLRKEL